MKAMNTMRDKEIKEVLGNLSVQELIRQQRACGRASVEKEFKDEWAKWYKYASALLEDRRHGEDVRSLAHLLKQITFSLARLNVNPVPTYYPYTDAHLLDWYLGKRHEKFHYYKEKSIEGIFYLLSDLLRFESESLVNIEGTNQHECSKAAVIKRIQAIEEAAAACADLCNSVTDGRPIPRHDLVHYERLEGYATEPSRLSALIHFSCMPQTQSHDEVLFLRIIHMSEFCFFGIRWSVIEATENIKNEGPDRAAQCLRQAIDFGKMLHRSFKVLRTMPVKHFISFRGATGHASAVQSQNYQLMETYFSGANTQKKDVYEREPNLTYLNRYDHPSFIHLGKALNEHRHKEGANGWEELFETARRLDRQLLTWRGLHVGFARAYLKDLAGTGSTSGAKYLEKYLRVGLFPETTVDIEVVEEMFAEEFPEIATMFRSVPSHIGIAPGQEQWETADIQR
jgi:tryptophan 2,3-dioxygenase